MPVRELATPEELRRLIASGKPLVVKFSAKWCGDCQKLRPHFEEHAERLEQAGVTVARISLSEERVQEGERKRTVYPTPEHAALKEAFARHGFPTVVFFKDRRMFGSGLEDSGSSYKKLVDYFLSRLEEGR